MASASASHNPPPAAAAPASKPVKVSALLATYNWPKALDRVLDSLAAQTWPNLEIVVGDDGSGPPTRAVVEKWRARSSVPIKHAWQDDDGYRLARTRNLAASVATGDYFIMLDGDGLLLPTFVEKHMAAAERGWFTVGRRCYLRRWATDAIFATGARPHAWPRAVLFPIALFGGSNRPFQLLPFPQSDAKRRNRPTEWNKAQTCNLGVWRADYERIGGFDESYTGYGLEDTDFVVRLIRSGARRLTLEHADPVLHLWHPRRKTGADNRARLEAIFASKAITPNASLLLENKEA